MRMPDFLCSSDVIIQVSGMRPKMLGSLFSGDLPLSKLLHHLDMFKAPGLIKLMPVILEKLIRCLKRCTLVAVNKRMVPGNAFGIAGRKLKYVTFTIGMLVLRTRKGGLQKACIPQAV